MAPGEAAADEPVDVVGAGEVRLVVEVRPLLEHGVGEVVPGAVDLALRQRPELDALRAPRQRVGHAPHG